MLTVITGPMGSGKSQRLIDIYNGLPKDEGDIIVFALDKRGGLAPFISARNGDRIRTNIDVALTAISQARAMIIDECQWLDNGGFSVIVSVADIHGIEVYAGGLRVDHKGEPFEWTASLLSIADRIELLPKTSETGENLKYDILVNDDGLNIDKDNYKSVTAKEFWELQSKLLEK